MPPTSAVALATPPPPGLAEATKNSQTAWQQHLEELFRRAKDRFPDVVWELTGEEDDAKVIDEVWGHKAIVYARAPPSFQSRYFSFRPTTPYSTSPTGFHSQSAFSLPLPAPAAPTASTGVSRSPSPLHRAPSPSTLPPTTSLLRINTHINPALFSNELEYLYTGQGFGEAFEFLFDSSGNNAADNAETDAEDLRIDKLRKDLVFMWRSRLYSDVRIALSGSFSSSTHENTTAIFSSHRFILVSRCPYFHDALLSWPKPSPTTSTTEIPTLTLPSPPFTPPSLHFTLGFIYTGTLVFSHRTYDLSTAFAILRAALYLSLPSLHDEIQARIAHEMLHGLFHAFLPFQEYERLTQSKWGTGGCRCRQCARRAPRVLEFSLEDDVKNTHLERGARRALVGLFGEGWCTQEFAQLSPKLRESLLKGVNKRTTPGNAFPLLFAAEHALVKLAANIDPWADTVRDMVLSGRKGIDEVVCRDSEAAFASEEWIEIMEGDGERFGDIERVEWAMAAVVRGVKEPWAPGLYQTLVSGVLLKPHPTEPNTAFLASTSPVRQRVEQARVELLKWISKRWVQIRHERGFDALEGWAIQELSDYMEVPLDDLLTPAPPTSSTTTGTSSSTLRSSPRTAHKTTTAHHLHTHLRPMSNHPHTSRIDTNSEAASSIRVSLLSRQHATSASSRRGPASSHHHSTRDRDRDREGSVHTSSASSIRSARSSVTTSSAASDSTIGRSPSIRTGGAGNDTVVGGGVGSGMSPARRIVEATRAKDALKDRPDSKLTPASPGPAGNLGDEDITSPILNLPHEDDEDDGDEDADQTSVFSDAAPREADVDENGIDEDEDGNDNEDDDDDRESVANSEAPTDNDADSIASSSAPTPSLSPSRRTPARTVGSGSSSGGTVKKTLITRTTLASAASRVSPGANNNNSVNLTRNNASKHSGSASIRSGARKPTISVTSRHSLAKSTTPTTPAGGSRPLSRGSTRASTASTLSRSSTTTRSTLSTTSSTSTTSRPASSVSSTSTASTHTTNTHANNRASTATTESVASYRTASSGGLSTPHAVRSRKSSAASTASSVRTAGRASPLPPSTRVRKVSATESVTSTASSTSAYGTAKSSVSRAAPAPQGSGGGETAKLSPAAAKARQQSIRSVRSASSIKRVAAAGGRKSSAPSSQKVSPASSAPHSPADTKPSTALPDTNNNNNNERDDNVDEDGLRNTTSTITIKQPCLVRPSTEAGTNNNNNEHKKTDSTASSGSNATIKKKRSNETITTDIAVPPPPPPSTATAPSRNSDGSIDKSRRRDKPQPPLPTSTPPPPHPQHQTQPQPQPTDPIPRGATLDIGIPCIVSSKRKRFKAYARYIGEVEGEYGPWVGVEVPIPLGESWSDRDRDVEGGWHGTQWNDGTWGGVRYFEIGNSSSGGGGNNNRGGGQDWDYAYDDRATRRRRVDVGGGGGNGSSVSVQASVWSSREKGGLKREGDQLVIGLERMKRMRSVSPAVSDTSGAESRGLFVRPQQVLYVVDAVEDL